MLLNINATRGPTDCCSAAHGLLLSEATGLSDAESIIFNRGRSVASWNLTGRVFHHAQRPVERLPLNGSRLVTTEVKCMRVNKTRHPSNLKYPL